MTADGLLSYLTTRSETAFGTASGMLNAYVEDAWPTVDLASRDLAVDAVVRLTTSYIVQATAPTEESARRIAEIVTRIAAARP